VTLPGARSSPAKVHGVPSSFARGVRHRTVATPGAAVRASASWSSAVTARSRTRSSAGARCLVSSTGSSSRPWRAGTGLVTATTLSTGVAKADTAPVGTLAAAPVTTYR
jgi:hypothetical protein